MGVGCQGMVAVKPHSDVASGRLREAAPSALFWGTAAMALVLFTRGVPMG